MEKSLSVIISCYNEEGNIDNLISRCKKILALPKSEIILVNNGSTDGTKAKIEEYSKKNFNIKLIDIKNNIGFGNGIYQGLKSSKYNILAYTHADLQTDPNDILIGLDIMKNNNEFIKGIRVNKRKNEWSFFDIFISFSMTIYTSIILRKYLNDIHAQPVIFSRDLFNKIKFFPKDFMIDVWIFYIAKFKGFRVLRFPVIFNKNARYYGEGNNDTFLKTIKGSISHIMETIKIRNKIK